MPKEVEKTKLQACTVGWRGDLIADRPIARQGRHDLLALARHRPPALTILASGRPFLEHAVAAETSCLNTMAPRSMLWSSPIPQI